jgi:hypothetical protein
LATFLRLERVFDAALVTVVLGGGAFPLVHAVMPKNLDHSASRLASLGDPIEDRGPTVLLAMCPDPVYEVESAMSDTPRNDTSKQIRHLRELIAALDRRLPRIERAGEAQIARDAAALKKKALDRLAELQGDVDR